MKKTSIVALFLLCISCVLIAQNCFQNGSTNLESISDLEVEICTDMGNVPTDSEKSEARRLIDELLSTNDKIGIDYYMENAGNDIPQEQRTQSATAVIKMIIPWAALLIISLLTYFTLMICCSDCCPCQCCRCQRAEKIDDIKVPLAFTMIFSMIIIAFCIAGLAMSAQVGESIRYLRCTGIQMFADVNNGNIASDDANVQKWQGLQSVITNMSIIGTNLDTLLKNTNDLLQSIDAEELNKQYQDLLSENTKISSMQAPTSYYQLNKALVFLGKGDAISDTYIADEFKALPIVPQSKLFDSIYKNIIAEISNLKQNGQQLSKDQQPIKDALNNAKIDITNTQQDLLNSAQDFKDQTKSIDQGSNGASYVFYIVYGVFCLFSFLIVLSAIFIYGNTALSLCKCIMVTSCLFYLIFVIVGFLLAAILGVASGVLAESCDYIDVILTNQTKFSSLNQVVKDKQLKDIMTECLFGNGDILSTFDVQSSLKQITDLDDSVNQFTAYQKEFQEQSAIGNAQLKINQNFISSFNSFERVDIAEPISQTDQTNVKYVMRQQVKTCNNNKLSSVPDKMTYCDTTAYQYQPLVNPTFSPPANKPVCLQSATFTINRDLINQQIPGCSYFGQIDSQVTSQQTIWKSAVDQETLIIDKHQKNQKQLEGKFDQITKYTTSASTYLKSITDENTGVLSGVNCKFVSVSIGRVQDAMCVKTLRIFYYFWIFFAIISISIWLSSISIFRVSIGIYEIRKRQKYAQDQDQQQMPTQTQAVGVIIYQQPVQVPQGGNQVGYQYQPAQALVYGDGYQQVPNVSQQYPVFQDKAQVN